MSYLVWDEKYSVDIREIDAQHKRLVELINDLHDAMKQGKGRDVMTKVIQTLIDYATTHFATEENYMTKFNYSQYSIHKLEHNKFSKQVLNFQKEYNSGKVAITIEVMNFLKDWLVKHILGTDKKYVPLFNENGIS